MGNEDGSASMFWAATKIPYAPKLARRAVSIDGATYRAHSGSTPVGWSTSPSTTSAARFPFGHGQTDMSPVPRAASPSARRAVSTAASMVVRSSDPADPGTRIDDRQAAAGHGGPMRIDPRKRSRVPVAPASTQAAG